MKRGLHEYMAVAMKIISGSSVLRTDWIFSWSVDSRLNEVERVGNVAAVEGTVVEGGIEVDGRATVVPFVIFNEDPGNAAGTDVTNGAEMDGMCRGCDDCCAFPPERMGEK